MPSSLKRSSPTQVNFFGTTRRVFSNVSDLVDLTGSPDKAMRVVPDGSNETLACMTNSGANANVGWSVNLENRLYTGRWALAVYLDQFFTDTGTTPATSNSAFHQARLSIALSNSAGAGAFTDATTDTTICHFHNVMLTRGWNVIPLSRALVANVARNAAATAVLPQIGGTGTLAIPAGASADGTGATLRQTVSLFDAVTNANNLRFTVSAAGSGLFTRTFFKEIVDDYQCDSKTCLIFDDAFSTVYTDAFPLMKERGLVGSVAIISSLIGTSGYMTVAQVNELFNAGWDVINHTHRHLPAATMAGLTQAECFTEIDTCERFIQDNGWNRNNSKKYFVSPFGGMQRMDAVNYQAAITQAGCVATFGTVNRCIGGQLISPFFIPRLGFDTMGPTGAFTTGTGYNIATMIQQYTDAVLNGCSPMVMLHQFVNVPTDATMMATTELEQFLDRVVTLDRAGFTSVEPVTTAIPALTTGVGTGIRNLR